MKKWGGILKIKPEGGAHVTYYDGDENVRLSADITDDGHLVDGSLHYTDQTTDEKWYEKITFRKGSREVDPNRPTPTDV